MCDLALVSVASSGGRDYVENSDRLVFGIGDSEVCLNVAIINDDFLEILLERFNMFINVIITDPAMQDLIPRITLDPRSATVTIVDDDSE